MNQQTIIIPVAVFLLILPCRLTAYYPSERARTTEDSIAVKTEPSDTAAVGGKKKQKKKKEVYYDENGNVIKKGWTFGILPSIAYDADRGFQYGVLSNIYDYGDGSTYPNYLHSIYVEASYTTKNSGIFRVLYDTPALIEGHRFTADITYLPEMTNDFFGFNGFGSVYNDPWVKCKRQLPVDTANYISRAFYKNRTDLFRAAFDIEGPIVGKLNWHAGLGVLGYMTDDVNVSFLNRGKREEKKIPEDATELFRLYKNWGLIGDEVARGGWHPYLRGGLTYDSRNVKTNPGKGIYADIFLTYSAAFGNQKNYNNLRLNIDFRHYVTVVKKYLTFAYRLGFQNTIAGEAPYYMNNYLNVLFIQRANYEVLGGSNSLRGIMRNRILSRGFTFATVEFRARLFDFAIGRQQFYIGLNPFIDAGMVTQPYSIDRAEVTEAVESDPWIQERNLERAAQGLDPITVNDFFDFDANVYTPHFSGGIGLKIAMNENFVLSVDWAAPFDKRDNASLTNFYVKVGYLF